MVAVLVLTMREGFEAALIAGITMSYLKRTGHGALIKYVWLAIIVAATLTAITGLVLFLTTAGFEGKSKQFFEGTVMIIAAVVITHVWRRFYNLRKHTEQRTAKALYETKVGWGVFLPAFVAVLIEGVEIVLFLLASASESALATIGGAVIGLGIATFLGWIFYQTNRMGDAILFFYLLSAILIIIAAGLLAHGLHELQEGGFIPVFVEHLWDYSSAPVIGDAAGLGRFLKSAIGYDSNPGLLSFVAWIGYISIACWYFDVKGVVSMVQKRVQRISPRAV